MGGLPAAGKDSQAESSPTQSKHNARSLDDRCHTLTMPSSTLQAGALSEKLIAAGAEACVRHHGMHLATATQRMWCNKGTHRSQLQH